MEYRKPVIPSVVRGHQDVSTKPTDRAASLPPLHHSGGGEGPHPIGTYKHIPGSEYRALLSMDVPLYSSFSPDGIFHPGGIGLHSRLMEAKRNAMRRIKPSHHHHKHHNNKAVPMATSPPSGPGGDDHSSIVMDERAGLLPEIRRRSLVQQIPAPTSFPYARSTTLRITASSLPDIRTPIMNDLDNLCSTDPISFVEVSPPPPTTNNRASVGSFAASSVTNNNNMSMFNNSSYEAGSPRSVHGGASNMSSYGGGGNRSSGRLRVMYANQL
eukprot:PhF_6_TR32180/c0_g2_i2/m.47768